MRLGGRLAAAIEILEDIDKRQRPASDALKDWGASHRFAGAGDRAAIGNIIYDGLRRKRSAGWLLGAETPRAIGFGALLLEWRETVQSLNATLEGDKFAPSPLDSTELATIAARDLGNAPDVVRADCADWCAPLLQRAFGQEWVSEAKALATRPPLDLRVNTLKTGRPAVLDRLAATDGAPTGLAPHGIRIPPIDGAGRHPNVQADPSFADGWFEVQDEGSQIAADLAGVEPGMQVLDYCAGAGGKTLALSAAMQNHGQIFAHDAEKGRLAPIFERLQRAGSRNIQVASKPSELTELMGRMDLVLVDAPCTGSGTWRRRPDAKWRLTEHQLDARRAEQAAILHAASAYVKPGGHLVYITCSVFEEENRDQVEGFLSRMADFAAVDHQALWNARYPAGVARIDPARGILLTPSRSGTDGFFIARLRRIS